MTGTVQKAAKLAKKIDFPPESEVTEKLGVIDAKIIDVKKAQKGLFPLERAYATPLFKKTLGVLERDKTTLKRVEANRRLAAFPELSFEPLTWRDNKGWPKLVPFSLGSATFSFQTNIIWKSRLSYGYYEHSSSTRRRIYRSSIKPDLPKPIRELYQDVVDKIDKMAKKEKKKIVLATTWSGLIPQEVKLLIREHQKDFKELLLLAEPTAWELSKIEVKAPVPTPVRYPDPLLVGFDGEKLWLIKQFDVTTLEHYVASEFTT